MSFAICTYSSLQSIWPSSSTKRRRGFPEIYGLTSQMRKAAVSVVSNLAEGQGRITEGELRQFLSQDRGSLFEVEAQCLIASRLAYLEPEPLNKLQLQIKRTNSALRGLIEYVRGKRPRERRTSNPRNLESP